MSTPAEHLLAAADLLDKRASEAVTPWELDSDNHLALLTISMPYVVGLKAGSPHDHRFYLSGPDDKTTRYIATMHPEVGKALAAILRVEAEMASGNGIGWATDQALALADLVLAGEQEQVEP